ncbi:MAG: hypothetical protein VB144_06340 [Clostridia bacterium]|nr:hypothetical protein [Clostridia bacterium]
MANTGFLAAALRKRYQAGAMDYWMTPLVKYDSGIAIGRIHDGDCVVFCCRRGDREVQLTEAFTDPVFKGFDASRMPRLAFIPFVVYHEKFAYLPTVFPTLQPEQTMGEVLSKAGLRQLRVAESEKAAHVSFFFNGRRAAAFAGEERLVVPSPKSSEFLSRPGTSTAQVAAAVVDAAHAGQHDFILVNLAAGDIIGHLDDWDANIKCAEAVDSALGAICEAASAASYLVAVTADHGLLERFRNDDGTTNTGHTTAQAPFALIAPGMWQGRIACTDARRARQAHAIGTENACIDEEATREADREAIEEASGKADWEISGASCGIANSGEFLPADSAHGALSDVAPTLLSLMGIPAPQEMDGKVLFHSNAAWNRCILVVLDGWGIGVADPATNPIAAARVPVMDWILSNCPHTALSAAELAVGLPAGRAGNSETGHLTLGAGRVVPQDELRIAQSVEACGLAANPALASGFEQITSTGGSLHVIMMLSEKSSHGNIREGVAVLEAAKANGIRRANLHLVLDGRSSPPQGAADLLAVLDREVGTGIEWDAVTAVGRAYALDRSGDYAGKTRCAYVALTSGEGEAF